MSKPLLYLLPSGLGENTNASMFSAQMIDIIPTLKHFIVENEKTARRFLKIIYPEINQSELQFTLINKRFQPEDLPKITQFLQEGKEVGLLSEAGLPCIADPGNVIVQWCHNHNIQVIPFAGPSSIFMALMASGLNGQNFQFHGYLPIDESEKKKKIIHLEKESKHENKTQIFMETPFRNHKIAQTLLKVLHPNTQLCIASQITQPEEFIQTKSIKKWQGNLPDLHKKPTIFLFQK